MLDKKYFQHEIHTFLEEIEKFYDRLSFGVFQWATLGLDSQIVNIDTYFFSALKGTMKSIRNTLYSGQINDSYALLRKYHDSIIINTYANLYLKDNINEKEFINQTINSWVKGCVKLPEYRLMNEYIKKSNRLSCVNSFFYNDKKIREIRERCNDHMHFNFYRYAFYNDENIFLKDRVDILEQFLQDLRLIFTMHFVYMFLINEHYLMSSDYIEYLEMGDIPPEGSESWVAPFIQDIYTEIIFKHFPYLGTVLKKNSKMNLE